MFGIACGAFNPVIADGRRIYLTGYSSIYALAPKRHQGQAGPNPARTLRRLIEALR